MEKNDTIKVSKKCPYCNKRLFDKVSPTSGTISIKCPQCKNIVEIDLAYRRSAPSSYSLPSTYTSAAV